MSLAGLALTTCSGTCLRLPNVIVSFCQKCFSASSTSHKTSSLSRLSASWSLEISRFTVASVGSRSFTSLTIGSGLWISSGRGLKPLLVAMLVAQKQDRLRPAVTQTEGIASQVKSRTHAGRDIESAKGKITVVYS